MSANRTPLQSPRTLYAVAVVAAMAGYATSATDATAGGASGTPKTYYFHDLCSSKDSCVETVKTIGPNKRLEIKDFACRLFVSSGGEAVIAALRVESNGGLASLNDFETHYNGTRYSNEFYVAGRQIAAVAGPSSEIKIELWATQDIDNAHCTLSGNLVKLN